MRRGTHANATRRPTWPWRAPSSSSVRSGCHLAIVACAALAGCGFSGASERPDKAATLLLDAPPSGVHAGIFSTMRRGYAEAEGVHLRVRVPAVGSDAGRALLTGRADFAVLDLHQLARERERGRDLVALLALVQRPLVAVLAPPGTRSPRALAGQRVGVPANAPWDAALARAIVPRARPVPLSDHPAATVGRWDVDGVALRQRRPGAREFRLDHYGAPNYPELVLVATRATVDTDPTLCAALVRALARGYRFTLSDPPSSVEDLVASRSGLDPATLGAQLDVLDAALVGASGAFGVLDPAALRRWASWEAKLGVVRRAPNVARAFEPRFAADAAREDSG